MLSNLKSCRVFIPMLAAAFMFCGCMSSAGAGNGEGPPQDVIMSGKTDDTAADTEDLRTDDAAETGTDTEETDLGQTGAEIFKDIKTIRSYKPLNENNPVMVQRFGADPWALVYKDRVYLYMTADDHMTEASGEIKENNYSNINKINVISSADLVNWTDHGSVFAAGKDGAATWGGNSWAPAAAWKNIDGKDRFFLYFANSGNGIAVLSADSPTGPFTDPIGKALISRQTPTCAEVTWLFDPAVLTDVDGQASIYFGGGIPSPDKAGDPGTARVAKLADDMISLDGDPVPIEHVPYLFEDSGINRIGDTYYYSYCSNFNVTPEAEKELGIHSGEIVTMSGDDPMGPFKLDTGVLLNPGDFFGDGGNNHHCMFEFKGEWYITYHARLLEKAMDSLHGYRSTNVDRLQISDKNAPAKTRGTKAGTGQICNLDPYAEIPAVTLANAAGIKTRQYGAEAEKYGSGDMILTDVSDGSWTCVKGADFGEGGASSVTMSVMGSGKGMIRVSIDTLAGDVLAYVPVEAPGDELAEVKCELINVPSGVHDLFFTFSGSDYELHSWRFDR